MASLKVLRVLQLPGYITAARFRKFSAHEKRAESYILNNTYCQHLRFPWHSGWCCKRKICKLHLLDCIVECRCFIFIHTGLLWLLSLYVIAVQNFSLQNVIGLQFKVNNIQKVHFACLRCLYRLLQWYVMPYFSFFLTINTKKSTSIKYA